MLERGNSANEAIRPNYNDGAAIVNAVSLVSSSSSSVVHVSVVDKDPMRIYVKGADQDNLVTLTLTSEI